MTAKAPLPSAPPRAEALPPPSLLDLLMRLADLMTHETSLLSAGHVQDLGPLQREKLRLTALYQQAVKEVQTGKVTPPPALRTQIIAASARLAQAAVENERALRIGRAATRRLIDMVVASIKSRLQPLHRYTHKRQTRAPRGAVMAVAVDRRM